MQHELHSDPITVKRLTNGAWYIDNLIPDALLSSATTGSTAADVTNWVKVAWKGNCTTEVVTGSMFPNQKSIRVFGTGATGANAVIRAIMPMDSGKIYNIGLATYKHTSANLSRAVRVRFYDKDDNLLEETSNYLYQPDQSPTDEMWFPFISRQVTAPSGTAYAHVDYSVSISGSGVLAVGEYIDVEYLYCEEY